MPRLSRRELLISGISASPLLGAAQTAQESANGSSAKSLSTMLSPDFRTLVSRADLRYSKPVARSEEGQPIGNGRMGSLVWTTPSSLKFQINRVDVFAENRDTNSFPERHTDYGSGCGFVDIELIDFGPDVFTPPEFDQHLSVYDAIVTARGKGLNARVLACHAHDVIAVEIDDQRQQPPAIKADLRMLRYGIQYLEGQNYALANRHSVKIVTRNHSATSTLAIRNGRTILTQEFREGDYFNSSAVVIGIVGRSAQAKFAGDATVRLAAAPGRGRFTILIASASSFDPKEDVAARALGELEVAAREDFDSLASSNRAWWHDFWSRSLVRLESADGAANEVERNYTYYLYVMGASSRGKYPPRFGGMLWFTNGDMREWGAQHWWANASCDYNALVAVNRPELMEPCFSMYSGMHNAAALAAKQQWGSQGIFIPETVFFDGLETLPDDIAAEMRDLYLMRKPWAERSQRFREHAESKVPHNSRWNWKDKGKWVEGRWIEHDKGCGPFGQVSHIFSSQAKIAHLYWQHYEHTQDLSFLRERAYPMLKGVAEFYRHFPNLRKETDGRYHIHEVNNHEPVWGARDTQEEMSGMYGILPVAIRAAEILHVDTEVRESWRELLHNLAALPTNASPGSPRPRKPDDPEFWIAGLPPVRHGNIGAVGLVPALFYDLCVLETADQARLRIANATFDAAHPRIAADTPVNVLNRDATAAANLGRADAVRYMLPNQLRCLAPDHDFCDWKGGGSTGVLANRMTLREGPGAIGVERIGRVAEALHAALLQSGPPEPGGDPVLHVFAAWPKEWNAQFTLAARGGFLVTSSSADGAVQFIEVLSRAGQGCRVRNPWGEKPVDLYRKGKRAETLRTPILAFATQREETIVIVPAGTDITRLQRTV
jgi:hypothetical protein